MRFVFHVLLLFDLPFLIVPTFAWQRVREIFYTAIGTGANVQIAPTGRLRYGVKPHHGSRLESGRPFHRCVRQILTDRLRCRFTIRSPASSLKRISAQAPHSARWPRALLSADSICRIHCS
jgi:hypothetical protein